MMDFNINRVISDAILQVGRRSENYTDDLLVKTFVDLGPIFILLNNRDNQVLYGRRGTGKTHVLRYLYMELKQKNNCSIFIDLRTVGSNGGIYSNTDIPIAERATKLLVDTLHGIYEKILDYVGDNREKLNYSEIEPLLTTLFDAISEVKVVGPVENEEAKEITNEKEINSCLGLSKNPSLSFKKKSAQSDKIQTTKREKGIEYCRVHFPLIQKRITDIVKKIFPANIWVFLDEWAEIPTELQPYLGDLLRRTLFAIQGVTVKIGAIEHRANFRINKSPSEYVGMEIGSDVSSLNLDEYMVFDNNQSNSVDFFKRLIFKHIHPYLNTTIIENENVFVNQAFTQVNVFEELVKSSEGVPRDAINILTQATLEAYGKKISIDNIRKAALKWYNSDKEKAISSNGEALDLLHWIIDEVIGRRSARAFLFRSDITNSLIDFLYDSRILHVIKQNVSGKDFPGRRYTVYSIDYGCYVDLIRTQKAPKGLFMVETDDEDEGYVNVPDNDYRSIRRAILDLEDFNNRNVGHEV